MQYCRWSFFMGIYAITSVALIQFNLHYSLSNLLKHFSYAFSCPCRCMTLYYIVTHTLGLFHLGYHLLRYLPLFRSTVAFIPSQSNDEFAHIIILLHLIGPVAHTLKSAFISQIITYYCSYSITVVHAHQWPKTIWTTCIPDVQFHNSTLYIQLLLHIRSTYCNIIILAEWILAIPLGNGRFSNTWIS